MPSLAARSRNGERGCRTSARHQSVARGHARAIHKVIRDVLELAATPWAGRSKSVRLLGS